MFDSMIDSIKEKFKKSDKTEYTENVSSELSIYCRQGEYAGVTFPMSPNDVVTIGKNPNRANIVLTDVGVSRMHCTVAYSEQKDCYVVTDYSSNGTYLENGARLAKEKPTSLRPNSSIFFGKETQIFELNKKERYQEKPRQAAPRMRQRQPESRTAPAYEDSSASYSGEGRRHHVPKCTCCGYVGEWKVASLVRPIDIVIFLLFFLFWGAGFIYLIVVILIRLNPDRRAKICPQCKAKNLWTFYY